jgi:holo-[acyl-carrier protein] synthase
VILGLGTDLVGIERIRKVYARQGERFLERIYTAEERAYCQQAADPAERLAARWAAKEAVMKALGTGWAAGVDFPQIAVVATGGAPQLALSGVAATVAEERGIVRWHLSLSHSDGMAIATAIAESA